MDGLLPYVFKNSSTFKKIKGYLAHYKKEKYHFDNSYQDAGFELTSCEMISDEADLKVVKTQELWNFVLDNGTKTFYYKVFNKQTYYLKKDINEQWKVWDNYNPQMGSLKELN